MVEEVTPETNAVPREPEATPAAASPSPAQPAEAQKYTSSPQSRKQAASAPAPAAAPAEPGKKEAPQASALSGGMQGGMQGMMQMIFMMIAQFLGFNITAMQQAQANQNRPAVAAPAPLGSGLKPTSTGPGLNPNAPSGPGLKVQGTTPTPSQSQVRTADNEIDAAAAKPAAAAAPPKPDTGIQLTTGVPLEKDEDRRARLGMTQKQYDGLKAEETQWQADARGDGAIGDSPFVRADSQDATAQQKLGLDAIQWQVLKYENKDWQTKIDAGDKTLPKVGPMQQAFMDAEKKTALAAAPVAPVPAPPAAASAAQPQIHIAPGQETSGIQLRSDGVIPALVVDGEDPGVSRMKREYASGEAPRVLSARPEFGRAALGVTPEGVNRMLELRAEGREMFGNNRQATEYAESKRREEIAVGLATDGNISQRDMMGASQQARREYVAANNIEGEQQRAQRRYEMEDRRFEAMERREMAQRYSAHNREVNQFSRETQQAVRILSDGRPGNDGQVGSILAGRAIKEVMGGGVLSGIFSGAAGSSGRTAQRNADGWSRDTTSAVRILSDGRPGNDGQATGIIAGRAVQSVLTGDISSIIPGWRSGGETRTYPRQDDRQGGYDSGGRASRWDSNQISGEYRNATSYGVTETQRQQIIADYQMQQNQAIRTPDNGYNSRNPNNIFMPGG